MNDSEYMSGCQLRQYLHISTKKMKYLMDHNYIPHINTGHATHKYLVRIEDAKEFRHRMETQQGFLAELTGLFSSRIEHHPKPLIEVTDENCTAFRLWLEAQWAEIPNALPTLTASKLTGYAHQRIRELVKQKVLSGVRVGAVQYIVKDEFIAYMSSPEKLSKPRTPGYCELIRAFKRRQCRVRENEKRREKRNSIK